VLCRDTRVPSRNTCGEVDFFGGVGGRVGVVLR
jgi:hypothetical protein